MLVNIPYMEHMGIVNDRKNNNNIVNDREFLLTINHMYIYISHMRTMVLVYLPTWLGHLKGKCWDSYSSTMEHMGIVNDRNNNSNIVNDRNNNK